MNTSYYVYHMFFFVLLFFASCEDEKENQGKGTLIVGEKSYELDKALLLTWGEFNGMDEPYEGHHLILGVFSPEVDFLVGDDQEVDSITGTGQGAQFELFASNPQSITNQVFTLTGTHTLNTFSFGGIYVDFPFDTGSMWEGLFMESGTLTLSTDNQTLTLKVSFVLPGGETGTINYEGDYSFLEPTGE